MNLTNFYGAIAGFPALVHSPAPVANPAPSRPSDSAAAVVSRQVLGGAAASTVAQGDVKSASSTASAAAPTHPAVVKQVLDGAVDSSAAVREIEAKMNASQSEAAAIAELLEWSERPEIVLRSGWEPDMRHSNALLRELPIHEKLLKDEIVRLEPVVTPLYKGAPTVTGPKLGKPEFWSIAFPVLKGTIREAMCSEFIGYNLGVRAAHGVGNVGERFVKPDHATTHQIKLLVSQQDTSRYAQKYAKRTPVLFANAKMLYMIAINVKRFMLKCLIAADAFFTSDEWIYLRDCIKNKFKVVDLNRFTVSHQQIFNLIHQIIAKPYGVEDEQRREACRIFFTQALGRRVATGNYGFSPRETLTKVEQMVAADQAVDPEFYSKNPQFAVTVKAKVSANANASAAAGQARG